MVEILYLLQLSPGRECSDTDMDPQASQSQDCEPTPPLQRHNSNFYLPPLDGDSPRHVRLYHPRHSPHAVPRYVCHSSLASSINLIKFSLFQSILTFQQFDTYKSSFLCCSELQFFHHLNYNNYNHIYGWGDSICQFLRRNEYYNEIFDLLLNNNNFSTVFWMIFLINTQFWMQSRVYSFIHYCHRITIHKYSNQ